MRSSAVGSSCASRRNGHRVGHDAILLAAATFAHAGEQIIDLGAGVGAAGLAVARRIDGVAVTLVEIDPALAALASENAARNALPSACARSASTSRRRPPRLPRRGWRPVPPTTC